MLRSTHLRMVTSSLVSKELLSVAEACCFFKDSSSSSAWDTKKMILVYYHQTTFGRVPGRNLLPADKSWRLYYSGLLSFWHRHQDKQIYPLHTISPLTYFLFHNVLIFLPLTRFYSICLIVVFSPLILLSSVKLSLISICTPIFLLLWQHLPVSRCIPTPSLPKTDK